MSRKLLPAIAALVLLLTSCAPATREPSSAALTPYHTLTPSPTTAPETDIFLAETVLPSPTPFTYTIQAGDTMGELAQKFGVPLDALIAANPNVSPNAMPVGATLRIPADENNPTGEATPTPVPFAITQVQCYPTLDGGMWCFALARNDSADALENLSARLSLLSASLGATLASFRGRGGGRGASCHSAPQRFTAARLPAVDSFLPASRPRGRLAARPDSFGHDPAAGRPAIPERVPAQPADRDRVRWPHGARPRTGIPARGERPRANRLGGCGGLRRRGPRGGIPPLGWRRTPARGESPV